MIEMLGNEKEIMVKQIGAKPTGCAWCMNTYIEEHVGSTPSVKKEELVEAVTKDREKPYWYDKEIR